MTKVVITFMKTESAIYRFSGNPAVAYKIQIGDLGSVESHIAPNSFGFSKFKGKISSHWLKDGNDTALSNRIKNMVRGYDSGLWGKGIPSLSGTIGDKNHWTWIEFEKATRENFSLIGDTTLLLPVSVNMGSTMKENSVAGTIKCDLIRPYLEKFSMHLQSLPNNEEEFKEVWKHLRSQVKDHLWAYFVGWTKRDLGFEVQIEGI